MAIAVPNFHEGVGHATMSVLSMYGVGNKLPLDMLFIQMEQQGYQPYPTQQEFASFLRKYPTSFHITRTPPMGAFVMAKTNLGICEQFWNKERGCQDVGCRAIHMCKYFLLSGNCKFKICLFGHSFQTTHNAPLLQANFLYNGIDEKFVRALIVDGQKSKAVPLICKFYNVDAGCRSGDQGSKCPALHVCKHYIKQECSFGQRCKRSHNIFDGQPKSILAKHGFDLQRSPKEVLEELRAIMKDDKTGAIPPNNNNISAIAKQPSSLPPNQKLLVAKSADEEPEICSFYLSAVILNKNNCKFGASCRKVHCAHPYQWQHFNESQDIWICFKDDDDGNQAIELTFSDPKNNKCFAVNPESGRSMEINFESDGGMTGTEARGQKVQIRRISTPSAGKDDTHRFPTEWIWYFKNNEDHWQEYKGNVTSAFLEKKFQANPQDKIQMSNGTHQYILDLSIMKQQNVVYKTQREMRRRPRYQTNSNMIERSTAAKAALDQTIYPDYWDKSQLSRDIDYNIVRLGHDPEKDKISKLFAETMPHRGVSTVERIQNPDLWEEYTRMKKKMERKSSTGQVEERLLFHGTHPQYIDAICQQGFDWRIAGKSVGTKYGKGSYFAKEAKYSHSYNHGSGRLFVVRVLVGEYTQGRPEDVRPAPKDPRNPLGELYDSSVDSVSNPTIFVVFEKHQAYPEYIIGY